MTFRGSLLATMLLLVPAIRAQGGDEIDAKAEQKALQERIDKAIADYEKVRKDKDKLAQRRRLLGWLGEIDHPRVTGYLQKELRNFARYGAGTYVIEALGKVPRPDTEDDLFKAIRRGDANHSVRVAATKAIVGFGGASVDRMVEFAVDAKNAKVRRGVLQGLATCDSKQARREVARMMTDGEHEQRLFMLLATAAAKGDPDIDRARVQCLKEGNLIVAATAWRILAEQGHRRAPALTLDVIERVYDTPDARAAVELVRGLAIVGDQDFFPALLRFGAVRGRGVKDALRRSARHVARRPELIEYLIEEGITSDVPGERTAAKLLLTEAPASALQPLVEEMRKQLKRNRRKVLDTAAGLQELLAKDPTWVQDLASLAAASDLESRMLGLAMLLEMGSPAAITSAQKYTRHRAWELRSLAFRYLTKHRDVTSIPFLIARYGAEEGRLEHELQTALFVHTGTRCWSRSNWNKWWRDNREGFALPHPNSVKGGGSTSGGQTVSYYDIPLVSSRIAFVVDHSGSMKARVGTDRKRTRLDAAKEQLRQVVSALPKKHKVNLILFESNVGSVWKEIEPLNNSNRKQLLKEVDKIPYAGGTNTFGGIELAFQDPNVDTIYLLTDGQPTPGKAVDPDEILEAVQRLNRTRQIVIHCISVGQESTLLQDLAALTGGTYKKVL
ncbi:MAG: VWA domain-containing protein, partial [Planctomycetes bacterium]|nr:VWA domain-containing protein [Planctomycetota bacterium]